MRLRTLVHWAIIVAAIAMLFVAVQIVMFLLSLDQGSRTQGSPAGTAPFALALGARGASAGGVTRAPGFAACHRLPQAM